MTEARANEIFKTKYPNGSILRKNSTSAGNKYWVVFDEHSKVYYYSATSYTELLRRLKFNVIYKHNLRTAEANVKYYQNRLDKLSKGEFEEDEFDFDFDLLFSYKEQILESTKENLADAIKILKYYQNECIVD